VNDEEWLATHNFVLIRPGCYRSVVGGKHWLTLLCEWDGLENRPEWELAGAGVVGHGSSPQAAYAGFQKAILSRVESLQDLSVLLTE
jgi:hypothetical protein